MGGEFGFVLLFVGAVLGVVASVVFVWRSKARLPRRLALSFGLFVVVLVLPLSFFVAFGLSVKHTTPQPILQPAAPLTQ
jgi:predicted PurR-regulated permease PerM